MTNANVMVQKIVASNDATIDLSIINRCDSAGIAALLEAKSLRLAKKKHVKYINASQQICELASFLKVSQCLFE